VRDEQHLEQVRRGDHDSGAVAGGAANGVVDLLASADVDTDGRLVEQEEQWIRFAPLAEDDLLLVSAGEGGDRRLAVRCLDLELGHRAAGAARGVAPVHDSASGELVQTR
jgi:hypothetical protein